MAEKLLSLREFERQYGPKKSAFYQLLRAGTLQAVKIGRSTYVTVEAAEEWKASLPSYQPLHRITPAKAEIGTQARPSGIGREISTGPTEGERGGR